MTSYRISADIGGTFTDLVAESPDGTITVGKTPTTPDNPARGVISAIRQLVGDASKVEFFVHGTTVGINALLERRGERVLLIATAGHRDGYTIARGDRRSLYALRYRKPELLVPRRDIHEVRGRIAWDGEELAPLVEEDFKPVIDKARSEEIRSIAVCFLHAFAWPAHELAARRILASALPDTTISLSHELAQEWREHERASTTVMNAYVAPVMRNYLSSLEQELGALGTTAPVHVMQSNGGVATARAIRQKPVSSLMSGPVGGTIGGGALASTRNNSNLLCVDMGGTSFDLSLVIDGEASTTQETMIEGLPLLMSIIDIHTIGAGGGSIAWLDNDALRVGPKSAGSQPGPACYGRGGQHATVTDANLFLGRLGTKSLLEGDMTLDEAAASKALASLAASTSLSPTSLAEGILTISNAAMADAMRTVTISQGVDPRDFTLLAFGGAGPMAAAFLAMELDMQEVLIPRYPGAFSAWGMLQTDLQRDLVASFFRNASDVESRELAAVFARLEEEGGQALSAEGVQREAISCRRTADLRYVGQEYTINVPLAADLQATLAEFHQRHQRRYGHADPAAPVEFVNLRLAALGALRKRRPAGKAKVQAPHSPGPARLGERQAVFDGTARPTAIYARERLAAGFAAEGPLVMEERSATTVVPPGWRILVEGDGSLLLRRQTP